MSDDNEALRLVGDQVVVRSVAVSDLPALEAVMRCPGVRSWWWDFDIDEFAAELDDPDVVPLIIEHAGEVVGFIQFSEEISIQYRSAGIDLSLHDDHQGKGYGSDAVRAVARFLFAERGHHRLTIDPALRNVRAIRCYERVGFKPVGVMRQYERSADGEWHDGLLMDLIVDELR